VSFEFCVRNTEELRASKSTVVLIYIYIYMVGQKFRMKRDFRITFQHKFIQVRHIIKKVNK
jgi:hypothetical protein